MSVSDVNLKCIIYHMNATLEDYFSVKSDAGQKLSSTNSWSQVLRHAEHVFKIIGICFTFQRCFLRAGMDNSTRHVSAIFFGLVCYNMLADSKSWGEEFLASVQDQCQPSILWNLDSYGFVAAILVQKLKQLPFIVCTETIRNIILPVTLVV